MYKEKWKSGGNKKKSDIEYQEFSKIFPLMQHFW